MERVRVKQMQQLKKCNYSTKEVKTLMKTLQLEKYDPLNTLVVPCGTLLCDFAVWYTHKTNEKNSSAR